MVEYVSLDTERTYYVVFDRRRGAFMFWHLFTSRGFDHVFLVTEMNNGSVLVIKPTPSECLIENWDCNIDYTLEYLKPSATAILEFKANFSSLKLYYPRGIISCVTIIKYLLGFKTWCLTPYGLYKTLLKKGATEYGKQEISTSATRSTNSNQSATRSASQGGRTGRRRPSVKKSR